MAALDHVDTVDLKLFREGNEGERSDFCRRLFKSFAEKGFVKVVNHGLSEEYISEGFRYNKALFELPYEEKMTFAHPPRPNPHRGYSYVGQEKLSGVSGFERGEKASVLQTDLKESFDHGAPENSHAPNVWPRESALPGFKDYMLSYFENCYQLHLELLSALALSINLPASTFTPLHTERVSELRCLHYLSVPAADVTDESKTRIAEHTDFGTMTLLMQDGSGGLEIKDPLTGSWYSVECAFPTLIVNVGDSLMRMMNRKIHSACHRVPLSAEKIVNGEVPTRYSIAYFGKPNYQASLKALDVTVDEKDPARYETMTAAEYEQTKLGLIYASA